MIGTNSNFVSLDQCQCLLSSMPIVLPENHHSDLNLCEASLLYSTSKPFSRAFLYLWMILLIFPKPTHVVLNDRISYFLKS